MGDDLILAAAVKEWVQSRWPGAGDLAAHAAAVALRAREGGASVAEACGEVRRFVACWFDHPTNVHDRHGLPLAS